MAPDSDDTQEVDELRGWLAKRLKMDDVPSLLWDRMVDRGLVEEALNPNQPLTKDEFLSMVREEMNYAASLSAVLGSGVSARGQGPSMRQSAVKRRIRREDIANVEAYDPLLDPVIDQVTRNAAAAQEQGKSIEDMVAPERVPYLRELLEMGQRKREHQANQKASGDTATDFRTDLFSLYLTRLAMEDPEIKAFREAVWKDAGPLSIEEANKFIFSAASAVFSAERLKDLGIRPGDHDLTIPQLDINHDNTTRRITGSITVRFFGSTDVPVPFEGHVMENPGLDLGTVGTEYVRVLHGSALSELLHLANDLAKRFPWRPAADDPLRLLNFILTGAAPHLESIKVTLPSGYYNVYEPVTITVWPWLTADEVGTYYEQARKILQPTSTTSRKRLDLLSFLLSHPEVKFEEGEEPAIPSSWRDLQDNWNTIYPEGHEFHISDTRNFRRDVREAFDQTIRYYRSGEKLDRQSEDLLELEHPDVEDGEPPDSHTGTE